MSTYFIVTKANLYQIKVEIASDSEIRTKQQITEEFARLVRVYDRINRNENPLIDLRFLRGQHLNKDKKKEEEINPLTNVWKELNLP